MYATLFVRLHNRRHLHLNNNKQIKLVTINDKRMWTREMRWNKKTRRTKKMCHWQKRPSETNERFYLILWETEIIICLSKQVCARDTAIINVCMCTMQWQQFSCFDGKTAHSWTWIVMPFFLFVYFYQAIFFCQCNIFFRHIQYVCLLCLYDDYCN